MARALLTLFFDVCVRGGWGGGSFFGGGGWVCGVFVLIL